MSAGQFNQDNVNAAAKNATIGVLGCFGLMILSCSGCMIIGWLVSPNSEQLAKLQPDRKAVVDNEVATAQVQQNKPPAASSEPRDMGQSGAVLNEQRRRKCIDALISVGIPGMKSIAVSPAGTNLAIEMGDEWHYLPYNSRVMMAQQIESIWVRIASPANPRLAMIKLVDSAGNEVGGSKAFGGVWVVD